MNGDEGRRERRTLTRREFARLSGLSGLGVLGGLGAFGVTGCAGSRAAGGNGSGGSGEVESIVFGIRADVRSVDPAHAFDADSASVYSNIYDTLLHLDADGAIHNHLAESWRQPDDRTYVYTIRDGVRFWDGSKLTAEDVAFSLDRHRDKKLGSELSHYFDKVDSIKVTGPREVTVKLSALDQFFKFVPAVACHVMKKSYVQAKGEAFGGPDALTMATGPYRITSYSSKGASLVRNPKWWGPKPAIAKVDYQIVSDNETLRLAMQSGEVDLTRSMPLDESRRWERLDKVNVKYARSPVVWYLAFDQHTAPWDDLHVRRAVSYAADRQGIVSALFDGHARAPKSPVATEYWNQLMSADEITAFYRKLPGYEFDLDKAKAELAKSKHPNGFTASVPYDSSDAALAKSLQNLAENLSKIGVTLKPKGVPRTQATSELYGHKDLGLRVGIFAPDYNDPATFLDLSLAKAQMSANGWNFANFTTAECERLIKEQATSTDKAVRRRALERLTTIMADQQPYCALYMTDVSLAHSDRLTYQGDYSVWTLYNDQMLTHVRGA